MWFVDMKELPTTERTLKSQGQKEGKTVEIFTHISELHIGADQLENDMEYTCQASHNSKNYTATWSYCKARPSAKPLIHLKKPHLSDPSLQPSALVTASCVVEAAPNSKVSWLLDEKENKNTSTEKKNQQPSRSTELTVSNLTLSATDWEQHHKITCRVKQPCDEKPEEKTVDIIEFGVKTPIVEIRRPLAKDKLEEDAVLECSARDVPSGELSVSFQVNQTSLAPSQYVDLPKGHHSLTISITVPTEHHKKATNFSCKVQQSPSKHWTSKNTANIFGDPSVELLLDPSVRKSGLQKLLCTGTGFKPKITWLTNSGNRTDNSSKATMQADGRMKVFSEMDVLLEEWNEGKEFTCSVNDLQETTQKKISDCAAHLSAKPLIHLEKPHLSDPSLQPSALVTASCVVEAAPNSKVSWLLDEKENKNTSTEKKNQQPSRSTELTVSNLTLSATDWEQHHKITCRVKQPCDEKPEEKTVDIIEFGVKTPIVEIRRPLAKDKLEEDAVLECSARDVPSGELSVSFQVNQTSLAPSQYVDLPKGQHSLTISITVPTEHHKKATNFSCKVQQSPSKHWTSQTTGNIFGGPSVELLLVPSVKKSGLQKLLCTGTGFKPKITWLTNSGNRTDNSSKATMQADGRMKVFSEMDVLLEEWNEGKEFTCSVNDLQETTQEKISDCAVTAPSAPLAQVYLLGPSLSDMRSADHVPLTCLVIGHRVTDFSIAWKVKKVVQSQGITTGPPKDHSNGTQSVQSILRLSASTWNEHAEVSCEVNHRCSNKTQDHNIIKVRETKLPTVQILRPSNTDLYASHNSTLLCLITGFYPADISVHWELDQKRLDVSRFTNSPVGPHSAGQDFSMHSALTLLASAHEHGTFSCVINHQSSLTPIISKLVNLYEITEQSIYFNENMSETTTEDMAAETWNMTCAFIALFLIALIYGFSVTLVRVKVE
uniref:Ig-like domain-containing protein n=2 Tax=Pygocentrus nattereri TaxID=42514 RepID=A0AAR2IPT3_PYGNA